MDIQQIRKSLAAVLDTIPSLTGRTSANVPDSISGPPFIYVSVQPGPMAVEYDATFRGGAGSNSQMLHLLATILVSKWDAGRGQELLDPYLNTEGTDSIYLAVNANSNLGGLAISTRVVSAGDYGQHDLSGPWLGARFVLKVLVNS